MPSGSIQYAYSLTQNNGQITQTVDSVSGETITYQYDSLKRLLVASSVPGTTGSGSASTVAAWTQTFQYDGFGNLTAKNLNGTTTSMGADAATNRLSGVSYYANGNMLSGAGSTLAYYGSNRLYSATPTSGGTEYFIYDGEGKQVYHKTGGGSEELTFYGMQGEKLAKYGLSSGCNFDYDPPCWFYATQISTSVWFGGKLIWSGTANPVAPSGPVYADRGGSNGRMGPGTTRMGMRLAGSRLR